LPLLLRHTFILSTVRLAGLDLARTFPQ